MQGWTLTYFETCPVGQGEWEVQLSDSYFQLSRAVGQSLMSIPGMIKAALASCT